MPDIEKVFGRPSKTIVIGIPLVSPELHGHLQEEDGDIFFTFERYIPRILVSLSFAKSVSEVKRNRKDLDIRAEVNRVYYIKFGRNMCYVISGFENEDDKKKFEESLILTNDDI